MASEYEAWRLTKAKYRNSALSGLGAMIHQGRWHRRGTALVYASENPSLALLETLVHVEETTLLAFSYIAIPIRFKERHLEVLKTEDLPSDWRSWPWPSSTQHLGTQWVMEQRSAVLQVPSVVVPKQVNYLINPSHADFPDLEIGAPEDFPIDIRIARLQ